MFQQGVRIENKAWSIKQCLTDRHGWIYTFSRGKQVKADKTFSCLTPDTLRIYPVLPVSGVVKREC